MSFFSFLGNAAKTAGRDVLAVDKAVAKPVFNFLNRPSGTPFVNKVPLNQQVSNAKQSVAPIIHAAQTLPKGGAQLGTSIYDTAAPHLGLPQQMFDPKQLGPVGTAAFGEKPIQPVQADYSAARKAGHGVPFSAGVAGLALASDLPVGPGKFLHDIPLGPGQLLRLSDDELKGLAKATTPQDVKKIIGDAMPANLANRVAPAIAQASDPNAIKNIFANELSPKPLYPHAQPPIQDISPSPPAAAENEPGAQTIIDALKGKAADGGAMAIRRAQEASYSQERGQRIGAAQAAAEPLQGSEAYRAKLSQLKGAYAKEDYRGLSDQLAGSDAESLYSKLHDQVEQAPDLSAFGKLNTQTALRKVIFGEGGVPTNSEIKLLQNHFGDELADTVKQDVSNHVQRSKLTDTAGQILGVPRAIMASTDLSASLRQGLAISTRHPIEAAKAFGKQFKVAFNEDNYKQLQDEIAHHPNYPLAQQAKLAIQDASGHGVGEREEQFASNLAEKVPGVGKILHASNRAYTGFLDSIRFNTFNNLVQRAEDAGVDFSTAKGDKTLRDIGEVINTSSGRGDLGGLEKHAQALSTALFAPRLVASRLQMLNPHYYTKLDPIARKEALTTAISLGAFVGGVLSLAKLGGASVSTNPTSADWGKIKVGDTRFDIAGGYQQYLRLGAQLAEGKMTSSITGNEVTLGSGYGKPTRLDIVNNFLQNKENPVLSFGSTLLRGKDSSGNDIYSKKGIGKEVLSRFTPLIAQDIADLVTHPNSAGLAAAAPGIVGVGLQTYGTQDLPLAGKAQSYVDGLQKSGAPKDQVNADKSFFQFLKVASGKQQNTSEAINKALAQGDIDKAQSLADDYNQQLIKGMSPWATDKNLNYLDDTLAGELTKRQINLTDQTIKARLQGVLNNPKKYGLDPAKLKGVSL